MNIRYKKEVFFCINEEIVFFYFDVCMEYMFFIYFEIVFRRQVFFEVREQIFKNMKRNRMNIMFKEESFLFVFNIEKKI